MGAGACVPTPREPVDLETVRPDAIRFGPAGPRATICPGEPTKFEAIIDGVDRDGDRVLLRPHRRELDDAIFDVRQLKLSSPHGFFDGEGVFYPKPDVMASVGTGFVVYARAPHGPSFSVRFPPSYECAGTVGREGRPGESGPTYSVYVTWVRTPDYTKLLAARAVGDVDMVTLAPPRTYLVANARGGAGLAGSAQGAGDGGQGGDGGDVTVVVDERWDDIDRMVVGEVAGGEGGPGGYDEVASAIAAEAVRGRRGKHGEHGRFVVTRGEARSKFENLGAIVPY